MPVAKLSAWKADPQPWQWPKAPGLGPMGPTARLSRPSSSSKALKTGGNGGSKMPKLAQGSATGKDKDQEHTKEKKYKDSKTVAGLALRTLVKKLHLNPNEKREKSVASAKLAPEEAVTQDAPTKFASSMKTQQPERPPFSADDRPKKFKASSKVHSEKGQKGLMRNLQARFLARQQIGRLSFCGEGLFPGVAGVCDEEIVEIFHSAELIRDFENGAASALEDCCDQSEANNEESGFTDGWMTPTTPVCGMDDCEAHTPHPAVMVPSREPNGDSKVDSETEKQSTTLERSNAKDDAAAAASDAEEKKMQLRSADSSDAKESRPVNEGEAKEGDGDEARSRKAAVMADVDDSKGVDDVNAGRSSADNDVSGIPRCSVCEKEGTDCSHRCQDEEAVRPILDEAMQQLSKCSQGTEDLPIKKVLLSSLLKQRAELTQALDQKTVQVEQMAEVVHAEALEKEDEIKSLQESLHRSRLEAASLKFLLTKRLKMDVEGLEAGSPLWGTFPGRGRRRRRGKDDWEKRMNPMREQACATDKNRNGNKNEDEDEDEANRKPSPSCRKESSSKANDDKPTHRERRNGSGKCSSSSSSSSSSYSSFSSEGDGDPLSLKKGAEKEDVPGWSDDKETVDTEAQAQKTTRGEEPGRSAFDFNMMDGELEGYEDWSMTAEEITELQKMCVLECREAVEIRLENERLKEENDKLTNECDRTRRLLELSQLRTKGNVAFNRMEFNEALEKYTQALELKVDDSQLNALLYCNRAAASSALGHHMDALADCIAAINMDETCTRAYSRRADVFIAVWDYTGALGDLVTVLEKEGDCSQEVELKMNAVKRRLKKHGSELDYYAILGIPSSSTLSDVRSAYRKLALKYHPDKSGAEKEAIFKYISTAYRILSDPLSRGRYDVAVASHAERHHSRSRSVAYAS